MTGTSAKLPQIVHEHSAADPEFMAEFSRLSLLAGADFINAVSGWLLRTTGLFGISIGDIDGYSADRVNVRGFACLDPSVDSLGYPLLGAPCMDVVASNKPLCVVDGARENYPQDEIFRSLGIKGYIGVPLHNSSNRPIGILCAFDRNVLQATDTLVELLTWVAPRISAELNNLRRAELVAASARWVSQPQSDDLFRDMLLLSTHALQVAGGFVAQWDEDDPEHYEVICAIHGGQELKLPKPARQPFAGAPCERLLHQQQIFIGSELIRDYPANGWLSRFAPATQHLSGYLGFVLTDGGGRAVGHIAWLHNGPMHPQLESESAAQIFRSRAAAEIDRLRADRERAAMADALLVKHKLESLGLMAGAIAHDFNNLLVTIIGNANLAQDHTHAKGKGYLEALEQAGIRAGDIVKQLLTYAGERRGELKILDLSNAVRNTRDLLELSKHPNANLRYQLQQGLPPTVCDHAQLQQIIINLVLNAVEALDGRAGDIVIKTYLQNLTHTHIRQLLRGKDIKPGRYVVLEVSDTGIGMNAETLTRMFDPFFTSKPNGRGLGMAALQGFASAFHSGVEVHSKPGQGTRIRVYLPPAVDSSISEHPSPQAQLAANVEKSIPILVVDDEPDVRHITARLLESLDYQVEACDSGRAAVELVSRGANYALAFIDVSMPGMNGWQTLKEIRSYLPDLAIVMISGYTEKDSATKSADEWQASFLPKPFRRHDLAAAIASSTAPRALSG